MPRTFPTRVRLISPAPLALGFGDPESDERGVVEGLAYTGAAVTLGGFGKGIIDLAGIDIPRVKVPLLLQHDPEKIVGFTTKLGPGDGGIELGGKVLESDDPASPANTVRNAARQGFPWQMSLGLDVGQGEDDIEEISRDQEVEVNGIAFAGPGLVFRSTSVNEVSFVPLGADRDTRAVVMADAPRTFATPQEEEVMATETPTPSISPKEIKAAFPDDQTFALEAICEGWSVEMAKAKYADVLAKKLQASEKARAEAESAKVEMAADLQKLQQQGQRTALDLGASGGDQSSDDGDPVKDWKDIVKLARRDNPRKTRGQVIAMCAREHRAEHHAYLAAYNAQENDEYEGGLPKYLTRTKPINS